MDKTGTQPDVSPLAHVHPGAKIGSNTIILPFSYIEADVEIGNNCKIGPNATILNGTRLGDNCQVFPGAVLGAIPQDLKFVGEYTTAEIGNNTTIRECVTINRGTAYAGKTVVGNNCLLMAYVHIAHDCLLGDNVILANSTNLAGHVMIDEFAILEGFVGVQQFVHIGAHSFVAATSFVRKNVPPFVKAAREPLSYAGVNSVGLTRRGYSALTIRHIQNIYRYIFVMGYSLHNALNMVENHVENTPETQQILNFIRNSTKGIIKGLEKTAQPNETEDV
ncbi:MAG: acyl-ACP--UDP-N-acetylglucosamine O-acyltransferase [Sphingobacteriales bacterium]|nr:MAG: acyl-ACP--UDP-N-acetylglucosamine O-acyltransferase [Sphingobacteriales bacterium]